MERLGPNVATEPVVLNRGATGSPTWYYPNVHEIISVPIREGNRLFGWLLGAKPHRRRRHHEQRRRIRYRRSLPHGKRRHDPGHSLRQYRTLPRTIRILQQRRASTHVCDRRQRPVHLRSQRSRGPTRRLPGARTELRQGRHQHDLSVRPVARYRQDRHRRQRAAETRRPNAGRIRAHQNAPRAWLPHSRWRQTTR